LAKQAVHPGDSRLAGVRDLGGLGLATTYAAMIRDAFLPEFWNGSETINGFSQMESNFSLFFGLAVQLYEATLIADQTPFDRWLQGDPDALSESADRGRAIFFSGGAGCFNCHVGPELTAASVTQATAPGEAGLIELMAMGDGALANYDIGFYNIAVTPTGSDSGRGGTGPFIMANGQPMPLSFARQYFAGAANLGFTPTAQPGCLNNFLADPPTICPPTTDTVTRVAVDGAFKTPGLRNVELTGPYMHNGGMATLKQVVDFYTRGGNFHDENIADLDPFITAIGQLQNNEAAKDDLVNFLLALTDERVRQESAPFDHPQLLVPDGHQEKIAGNPKRTRVLTDNLREIPAVGAAGRQAQGLPPIKPFLADDLSGAALAGFHFQP
jgi:cytochrome c peroxidase